MPKFKKLHLSILIISLVLLLAFVFVYIFLEDNVPTDTQLSSNSNITESFNQVITDDTSSGNLDDISQTSSDQSNDIQVSDDGVSSQFAPPVVEADGFTQEDIEQINKVIEKYGQNVSVFYKDIYSGNSYNYNQDNKYFIASLIKAPYAMYIYDLVSQGKCSLDDKFILTEEIKQQGTGKLKDMDADTELTLKEMLEYLIVNSDNTAMKMLLKKFPKQDYTEYAVNLGLTYREDIKSVDNGDITARDAGVYLNALYTFFESNKYGADLKELMSKTSNRMIISKFPMARKYGWTPEAFHDMAVVYADNSPYLLAILTDKSEGKKDDYKLFREISEILEKKQTEKYNAVNSEN